MEFRHCVYVHVCVCVRVFIQLDITAQSSPVILLIVSLCHSHWSYPIDPLIPSGTKGSIKLNCVCVCVYVYFCFVLSNRSYDSDHVLLHSNIIVTYYYKKWKKKLKLRIPILNSLSDIVKYRKAAALLL